MPQLGASFVQSHRSVIQNKSIQRFDRRFGFGIVCHFDESQPTRSVGVAVLHDGYRFHSAVRGKKILQLGFGGCRIHVSNKDVNHNFVSILGSSSNSRAKQKEAISSRSRLFEVVGSLECSHVFRLPALWSLGDIELHRLALLEALKTSRLDSGEVHENVFATLTADKTVAFGIVEPLYCSLFHLFVLLFLCSSYAGGIRRKICAGLLAVEARAAHNRFGLTHKFILPAGRRISKAIGERSWLVPRDCSLSAEYAQRAYT